MTTKGGGDNGDDGNGLDVSNGSTGYSSLEPSHPPPEDDEEIENLEEDDGGGGESLPLVTPPSPGREEQMMHSSQRTMTRVRENDYDDDRQLHRHRHNHRSHYHNPHRGAMTMTVTSSNESDSGVGHDDDGGYDDKCHDLDDDVDAGTSQLTTTMTSASTTEETSESSSVGRGNVQQRQQQHRDCDDHNDDHDHDHHRHIQRSTYADAVMRGIHDPMTNLAVDSPAKGGGGRPQQQQRQQQQNEPASQRSTSPFSPCVRPQQQQQQQQQQEQQQQKRPPSPLSTTMMTKSSSSHQTGGENSAEEGGGGGRNVFVTVDDNRYDPSNDAASSSNNHIDGMGNHYAAADNDDNDDDNYAVGTDRPRRYPTPPSSMEATAAHERQQMHQEMQWQRQRQQQKDDGVAFHQGQQYSTTTSHSSPGGKEVEDDDVQSTATATTGILQQHQRGDSSLFSSLSYILGRGSLIMINFSQRNLNHSDARMIHSAVLSNPQLCVLKLGYNNLGDSGAHLIASAIHCGGSCGSESVGCPDSDDGDSSSSMMVVEGTSESHWRERAAASGDGGSSSIPQCSGDDGWRHHDRYQRQKKPRQHNRHHPSLKILDLGFNNIGDEGCTSLARLAVSYNPTLSTLYLSGNDVGEAGALSLSDVLRRGCGLTSLHLTANRVGPRGVRALMRSMAEFDVTMQMAHQDRENRMAQQPQSIAHHSEEKGESNESKHEINCRRTMSERDEGLMGDDMGNTMRSGVNYEDVDESVDLESLGINDDEELDIEDTEPSDDLARLQGYRCMEELYLGGTDMGSVGCLSVSNMLLTNLTLRVICLSDSGLNDSDLSLFSQSLSRNRELPLEILRLSFNRLTCLGVETLMNAIWGSKTLREIKLDNNQIRDRGAQLAAVVMTSVDLEVLDMGFNRLTIVGIKALMKSLAENRALLTLTLSGNVLDTNASKAVSYALAYNKTIQKLYVDHCSLSYAAQRHIAAGIVSNSNLALRVMSGFPLGAISVTLGLPGAMETWSNEQVLKFIRVMWDRHRHEADRAAIALAPSKDCTHSFSNASGISSSSATSEKLIESPAEPKTGPSDPATVVAAAKSAFLALGDAGGALLLTEESQRSISDSSPMVSSDAVMLEKTPSGTIRVPVLDGLDENHHKQSSSVKVETGATHISTDRLCMANEKDCLKASVDPVAKRRNLEWLRMHYRSLNEVARLPYVHADLMQLYRYFYSPPESHADDEGSVIVHDRNLGPSQQSAGSGFGPVDGAAAMTMWGTSSSPRKRSILQRKTSYRSLHDIMVGQSNNALPSPNFGAATEHSSSKRRPVPDQSMQPATKRARSDKPRIEYFPRTKAKIDLYLSSSKQTKALALMRQLKFVETTMFHGSNPYCDQQSSTTCSSNSSEAVAADAEVVLIDMM
ncbi:hypothetical protein ACHAXA_011524 [Cyclostephanos tholiformis]|uniref:Uncharacterized protein n=1 Tax=Cyclostephanos tholiformis TaxID=382380 RepID=A0ABD3RTA7_9STRA